MRDPVSFPDTALAGGPLAEAAGRAIDGSALIERTESVLVELLRACDEQRRALAAVEEATAAHLREEQEQFEAARQATRERSEHEIDAARRAYEAASREAIERFDARQAALEAEFSGICRHAQEELQSETHAAEAEFREAAWLIESVCESDLDRLRDEHRKTRLALARGLRRIRQLRSGCIERLSELGHHHARADLRVPLPADLYEGELRAKFEQRVTLGDTLLEELRAMPARRPFIFVPMFVVLFLGTPAIAYAARGALVGLERFTVAAGGAALLGFVVSAVVYLAANARLASRRERTLAALYPRLGAMLSEARALVGRLRDEAAQRFQARETERRRRRDEDLANAAAKRNGRVAAVQVRHDSLRAEAETTYPRQLAELARRRHDSLRKADEVHRRALEQATARRDADARDVDERHRRRVQEIEREHRDSLSAVELLTTDARLRAEAGFAEINRQAARLFPDWRRIASPGWAPPRGLPGAIRIGEFGNSDEGPGASGEGVGADALASCPSIVASSAAGWTLPALLPLPGERALAFMTSSGEAAPAVRALQAVVLRILTTVPPGRVRLHFVDPLGLGRNLAPFMPLADYDDALIAGRVATEPDQIERSVAELTAHVERVIQTCLQGEYADIEEYNAHAGELAEPYPILVVVGFPAGFRETSAQRLVRLAAAGPRCGVYMLATIESDRALPHEFDMPALLQYTERVTCEQGRFTFDAPALGRVELTTDDPPEGEVLASILENVGRAALAAKRVQIPFEQTAPAPESYWTASSRDGLLIPLGRTGAARTQFLSLGQGTSQHLLVAGKTGSGKSTLLHVLITGACLHYSPRELELYLVDFKKGVEFKTYAQHTLPHVRVVGIESDREFGLSVLAQLDDELKRRGEAFRKTGVRDLASFRDAEPNTPMPRILLVVDEFQEFFVEDDKLAQDASLLLDRLVRQGRAFGIHVVLGSQTLSGAYTLARSTVSQMAVRIALQCSDSDVHLILSEANQAPKHLSRPGEAIYNDANGMVEGNSRFQVAWLSDAEREDYLGRIGELAERRDIATLVGRPLPPAVVFEGNAAAELPNNAFLADWLRKADVRSDRLQPVSGPAGTGARPEGSSLQLGGPGHDERSGTARAPVAAGAAREAHAWLGEAIAIKDPTSVLFRRQSASNLLILGPHAEAALGMMAAARIALAAQQPHARFFIFDGSPPDDPHHGRLAALGTVSQMSAVSRGELAATLERLAAEIDLRHGTAAEPVYLFVYDLGRFRDLRRREDDFGFSRMGEDRPAGPAELFAKIVREGPGAGVHSLVWCDSLLNLQRTLDRQGLREFDARVLLRMNATDSSTLIDSPLAARLGPHRALLYQEEYGSLEKFRPYAYPPEDWLRRLPTGSGSPVAS